LLCTIERPRPAISQKLTRPDGEIRASRVIGAGDRGAWAPIRL